MDFIGFNLMHVYFLQNEDPVVQKAHSHEGSETAVQVAKMKAAMKDKGKSSRERPGQILAAQISQEQESVRAECGNPDSIKRTIRRIQRKNLPKEPTALKDVVIEGEWTETADKEKFLIHDSGPTSHSRVIIFASKQGLTHLARQSNWYMDGTFSMAPKLFQQLYIICAQLGTSAVTCVYALLTGKSQCHYEQMLKAVIRGCEELGFSPDPTTIHLDFEQAAINAVKTTFGPHVQTLGCFYHLTQSTWRKIQELGLSEYYKGDSEFRHFCGMVDGLAFLPLHEVQTGMEYLRSISVPGSEALLDYFDATYVSGSFRSIQRPAAPGEGQLGMRLRKMPPLFPPQLWNVHEATMSQGDRTNNKCEAWNSGFYQLVGHHHPSLWRLLSHIKEDESLARLHLVQESRGQPPKKRVKKTSRDLQDRLKYLCTSLQNGEKSMEEFLEGVGHTIRLF